MRLSLSVATCCILALMLGCQRPASSSTKTAAGSTKQSITSPQQFVNRLKRLRTPEARLEFYWDVSQSSAETRFQMMKILLSDADTAEHFGRYAPEVTHACVGLDKELRFRIAAELITPAVKDPPGEPERQHAVLLLATELHLTRDFPKLATQGLSETLRLAKSKDPRTIEWFRLKAGVGQWVETIPAEHGLDLLRELVESARSNRNAAALLRHNMTPIADRLMQMSLAAAGDGDFAAILAGDSNSSIDGAAVTKGVESLFELILATHDPNLRERILRFVTKIPGGLSTNQAERALKIAKSDPDARRSLDGVASVVSNLTSQAVPSMIVELAAWRRDAQPSSQIEKRLRQLINVTCEQADSRIAEEALLHYENAIAATKSPSFEPICILVRKLRREPALKYALRQKVLKEAAKVVKTDTGTPAVRSEKRQARSRASKLFAAVARGLAESEVAITRERLQQLRFLLEIGAGLRQTTRTFDEALAAVCGRLDEEHRSEAVQLLLNSRLPFGAKCSGLIVIAPSLTADDSTVVIRSLAAAASQFGDHDAERAAERLGEVIDACPASALVENVESVFKEVAASGRPAKLALRLARQIPPEATGDMTRKTVEAMWKCEPRVAKYKHAIDTLEYVIEELVKRLPAAERQPIALLLANSATKALDRPAHKDEEHANRLALAFIELVAKFPHAIPPKAAEKLLDASLQFLEPPGDWRKGHLEVSLPAVANCIPIESAVRLRERIRAKTGEASTPFANRMAVVAACLPLEVSSEEVFVLMKAAPVDEDAEDEFYNLTQLSNAAPILRDKLNDKQLLEVIKTASRGDSKRRVPFVIKAHFLVGMMSNEASLQKVQLLLRALTPMHQARYRTVLSPGLENALGGLSIDDLPNVLDELIAASESQKIPPGPGRGVLSEDAVWPEVVVSQWIERLAAEHRDCVVAVLSSRTYQHKMLILRKRHWLSYAVQLKVEFAAKYTGAEWPQAGHLTDLTTKLVYQPAGSQSKGVGWIVELLKHPECSERQVREGLLARVSQHTGRHYDDVWQFVEAATEAGVSASDLARPPQANPSRIEPTEID